LQSTLDASTSWLWLLIARLRHPNISFAFQDSVTCDAFVCKLHEARAVAEANAVSEAEAAERISDFAALKAQAAEAKAESEDELEQFIAGCEDEALEEAECRTRILALSLLTVAYRAIHRFAELYIEYSAFV
jgi:hypothetical protein